jgi:hypothetical protein
MLPEKRSGKLSLDGKGARHDHQFLDRGRDRRRRVGSRRVRA